MAKTVLAIRVDDELLARIMAVGGKDKTAAALKCIEAGLNHVRDPDPNQSDLFTAEDRERASMQREKVFELMKDGAPRTIGEIARAIEAPPESIQAIGARIRDFRKARYGRHTVEKKQVRPGLFQYRLIVRAA